jgi:ADP-ribose pyrophosphatase YjhB (NUDIX family)
MVTPVYARDAHCSHCGKAFEPPYAYPRTCAGCNVTIWANPIPVSVVLLPVIRGEKTGLLVIRRDIQPGLGKLALVGGFLEEHETWSVGGARELREETGVHVDATSLEPFWFASTEPRPNRVLLFSIAAPVAETALGPFTPDHETSERGLIFGPQGISEVFAFPLHVRAAERFFSARGIVGPHEYAAV